MKKNILSVFVLTLVVLFSCTKNDNNLFSEEEEGIITNNAAVESVYESLNYETDYFTGSMENITYLEGGDKFLGEIGISILNVLNTYNIKYSNFERIPTDQISVIDIYN